jgi:hypothetical protein
LNREFPGGSKDQAFNDRFLVKWLYVFA